MFKDFESFSSENFLSFVIFARTKIFLYTEKRKHIKENDVQLEDKLSCSNINLKKREKKET